MKAAIGIQNFDELREKKYFYIDKTAFIKEWWDCGDSVTLITRPRRFGKTLNMSMIEQFFSVNYANRADLFEGLSVWEDGEYRALQGTYPVINLSFAGIKENDYETANFRIRQVLKSQYEKNQFLLESDKLLDTQKTYFRRMLEDVSVIEAPMVLQQLANFLFQHYGKKVIILLDEYDTPMQEAYVDGYWEELVGFTRSLFNSTFKTNPYLERGIMTGITRISKESIFSDLNNLEVVTTTSNKYATAFGFTEEEVFRALELFGFGSQKECVKYWYNGFTFGKSSDIYNPWSVLNFLATGSYNTYWANTSSNSLVSKLIREGGKGIKSTFESLLRGEVIQCPIDEQIVYNQLDVRKSAIWSLLLASGYLKVIHKQSMLEAAEASFPIYDLALTNYEVKKMFFLMVTSWFGEVEENYGDFVSALLCGDVEAMNICMNEMTMEIFSYFDAGSKSERSAAEKFYHGFVLGLVVELRERYQITSNRESGFGRYDVMLEPKREEDDAIIIEFKVFQEKKEKSLEETVKTALQQIEEKQYEAGLLAKGIKKERIKKYGFAFAGKEVLIG